MVYVFLADGFEIVEALAPVDMLTRAKVDVITVGVTGKEVVSSCGVKVIADMSISDFIFDSNSIDAIILPGGMPGTLNLEKNTIVQSAIDSSVANNILVCAICAAPSILGHKGLLDGKNAICFPGFEDTLLGAKLSNDYVVTDGNFITAKGAGVATQFGLEIVKKIKGEKVADEVRAMIQCL